MAPLAISVAEEPAQIEAGKAFSVTVGLGARGTVNDLLTEQPLQEIVAV